MHEKAYMNNTNEEFLAEKMWKGKWQGLKCLKNCEMNNFLAILNFLAIHRTCIFNWV